MKDRDTVLADAVNECFIEAYKWAQPPVDYRPYIDGKQKPLDIKEDQFYKRHYLSNDNFHYIIDKIKYLYHIGKDWTDNIELLLDYITNPESKKDKYIKEPGKPGYRGYENITPLQDIIKDETEYQNVMELFQHTLHHFNRDPEESSFSWAAYFGSGPICHKEAVEKYWQEHGYPEFKCIDFDIEDILYPEDDDVESEEEFCTKTLNPFNIIEQNIGGEENEKQK